MDKGSNMVKSLRGKKHVIWQYVGKGLDLRSYNNFDQLVQRESLVTLCMFD